MSLRIADNSGQVRYIVGPLPLAVALAIASQDANYGSSNLLFILLFSILTLKSRNIKKLCHILFTAKICGSSSRTLVADKKFFLLDPDLSCYTNTDRIYRVPGGTAYTN